MTTLYFHAVSIVSYHRFQVETVAIVSWSRAIESRVDLYSIKSFPFYSYETLSKIGMIGKYELPRQNITNNEHQYS